MSVEKEGTDEELLRPSSPTSLFHDDVKTVDEALVKVLALRFPSVSLVLLGAGPPCQGVSGLNASKKGALRDERSCLYQEVPSVRDLLKKAFPNRPG